MKHLFYLLMSIALVSCMSCTKQRVQTILLDTYYNHEINPETGRPQHYTWDDTSRWGGYSQFGELFASQGAKLSMLDAKPTASLLAGSDVYIIVDPDHEKDNPAPNYMDDEARELSADGREVTHKSKDFNVLYATSKSLMQDVNK